eukprot:gene19151-biopygen10061
MRGRQERWTPTGGARADVPDALLWNPRGLMAKEGHKLCELQEVISQAPPRHILLAETQLDESFSDASITVSGYIVLRQDRQALKQPKQGNKRKKLKAMIKQKGGGVLAYVQEDVEVANVSKHASDGFETLAYDDKGAGTRYILVYRKPHPFVPEELLAILEEEANAGPNPIILGDLNMNMASHVRYPQPRKLHVQLRQGLNLQQQIGFITRPKVVNKVKVQDRGSIIDHVWTKLTCRCSIQHALGSLSDHEAIRISHGRSAPPAKSKGKYVHRRLWRKVESRKILEILDREMPRSSWGTLEKDVPLAVARCDAAWERVKTELAPKKRMQVRPKAKLIKVSAEVRAARKERNRLHRIASKRGATAEDRARYWRSRDAAIKLHRGNVEEYVKTHWKKAGDKPLNPAHWRLVDALAGRMA